MKLVVLFRGVGRCKIVRGPAVRSVGKRDRGGACAAEGAAGGVWGRSPQRGPGAEPLTRGAEPPGIFLKKRPPERI